MTRWKLVPVEADLNMQDKATTIVIEDGRGGTTALNWPEATRVYSAMLSAAPAPDDAVIETVAKVLYEEDDPWHKAWPWPDLNPEAQGGAATADVYRRLARAVIDALLGEQG